MFYSDIPVAIYFLSNWLREKYVKRGTCTIRILKNSTRSNLRGNFIVEIVISD